MANALTFTKTPRIYITKADFRNREWRSKNGQYKIVHSVCLLGPRTGDQAMTPLWYAMKVRVGCEDGKCFDIISRHRVRNAAVKACEADSRRRVR